MRIIESIKESLRKLDAKFSPPTNHRKIRIYLKRGTLEEIAKTTPFYVGELVLCTDFPLLCVASSLDPGGFERINLSRRARDAFIHHYSASTFTTSLDWEGKD